MNLFPCALEPVPEGCVLRHHAFSLHLPWQPDPAPSEVFLGIRPEWIVLREEGEISAEVEVVQILGEEQIVDLVLEGGNRFKWVVPVAEAGTLARGDRVRLSFPPETVVLFDRESGRLLPRKEE